ncbi:Methylmalonyl-CoA carboxyltransferase 1.3S subunit [termite gut metagenome]|uniref:Methylmalonyl-CoA carboxyltransferase 1.3S subunit n=1 Tax=termite gut metagenome TaxID=433724 RepID=A0A5J4QDB6_9ZZZZ
MKQYKYKINGNVYNVTVNDAEENIAHVEVNGTPYKIELDKPIPAPAIRKSVSHPTAAPKIEIGSPVVARPAANSGKKDGVKSPLPGVVLDVRVKEGDVVKKGQTLIVLEAMKMENNINAHKDGKIVVINVNKGDSVLEGADLVIIE